MQKRLEAWSNSSLEIIHHTFATISAELLLSADFITTCLLNDKKIFVAGIGPSSLFAKYTTTLFLNRFEHDRPGLPAVNLSCENLMSAISIDTSQTNIFAKQLDSLCNSEDVLLLLSADSRHQSMLINTINMAKNIGMHVVVITSDAHTEIKDLFHSDNNIIIASIPHENIIKTTEAHIIVIHALCDLIDGTLFDI